MDQSKVYGIFFKFINQFYPKTFLKKFWVVQISTTVFQEDFLQL